MKGRFMFVEEVDSTSSIYVGEILYFNKSVSTVRDFHGCAIRIERIEDNKHVTATVPDRSWIADISVDGWNDSLDFDGTHVHVEHGISIHRLGRWVCEFAVSQELDDFLASL